MPRLLELFSGTKSVSKVAKTLGWETLSLDIRSKHTPDMCMDILLFEEKQYPKTYFNLVWASCPCESYSSARTTAKENRNEAMLRADRLLEKTIQIISYFDTAWVVENPKVITHVVA